MRPDMVLNEDEKKKRFNRNEYQVKEVERQKSVEKDEKLFSAPSVSLPWQDSDVTSDESDTDWLLPQSSDLKDNNYDCTCLLDPSTGQLSNSHQCDINHETLGNTKQQKHAPNIFPYFIPSTPDSDTITKYVHKKFGFSKDRSSSFTDYLDNRRSIKRIKIYKQSLSKPVR